LYGDAVVRWRDPPSRHTKEGKAMRKLRFTLRVKFRAIRMVLLIALRIT